MPRFHIHTLGCKVNRAESEGIAATLINAGWQPAEASTADVVIINTCTVTGEADAKNRKLIRSLLKASSAPVLVCGCAINIDADHYASIDERVVCESEKTQVVRRATQLASTDHGAAAAAESEPGPQTLQGVVSKPDFPTLSDSVFRTRVDVKIQDGCDNACTYCIVHTARGPARSVPADEVVEAVAECVEQGTQEVVLVGIDLAAYNDDGLRLSGLLERLLSETDIGRIRISSVEPQNMTDELIDVIASADGRICRHLHLCLQSGSSKVLSEMERSYDADEFRALVAKLRKCIPQLALSTDVIVGFPGETDDDFAQTCELVEQCQFMRLHVFRYSKREGTPAAGRDDQIAPEVKAKRSRILHKLGTRLANEDLARRAGTRELAIVETPGHATTESYHGISVDPDIEPGSLIEVVIGNREIAAKTAILHPM